MGSDWVGYGTECETPENEKSKAETQEGLPAKSVGLSNDSSKKYPMNRKAPWEEAPLPD